ncbi:HAD family hydrolase [Streptomyces sedi]
MGRLALFDLDDTLVDRGRGFARWAREFALSRGWGEREERWLLASDQESTGGRREFFGRVREEFGLAESADELWAGYRSRMPDLVVCPPETLNGLTALRRAGWRVGVVTNGAHDNQSAKIERTGIGAVVDGFCTSGELGIRKPDARVFRVAAERCGADLARGGWMVGDHPTDDIAGGRAAGLHTVWITHGRPRPAGTPAELEAADATEAIALLGRRS